MLKKLKFFSHISAAVAVCLLWAFWKLPFDARLQYSGVFAQLVGAAGLISAVLKVVFYKKLARGSRWVFITGGGAWLAAGAGVLCALAIAVLAIYEPLGGPNEGMTNLGSWLVLWLLIALDIFVVLGALCMAICDFALYKITGKLTFKGTMGLNIWLFSSQFVLAGVVAIMSNFASVRMAISGAIFLWLVALVASWVILVVLKNIALNEIIEDFDA